MAGEDYRIGDVNISKVVKRRKQTYNSITFSKLKSRFNLKVIESRMGMEVFELNGIKYYFSLNKGQIRKQNEKVWNNKVISYLKSEVERNEVENSKVKSIISSIIETAKKNVKKSKEGMPISRLDLLREKMNNNKIK